MNILLVEDNESIAKGLEYAFNKNSYKLSITYSVIDTIKYLENNNPSLIILDVSLPDGDGFELYKNIIRPKNIPVIFLTAKDEEEDVVMGTQLRR